MVDLVFLSIMLYIDLKSRGGSKCRNLLLPRNRILLTLMTLQVVLIVHYMFNTGSFDIFMQTLEETIRLVCFFQVTFYFIRLTSKMLPNTERWNCILRYIYYTSLLWLLAISTYICVEVIANGITRHNLCDSWVFILF